MNQGGGAVAADLSPRMSIRAGPGSRSTLANIVEEKRIAPAHSTSSSVAGPRRNSPVSSAIAAVVAGPPDERLRRQLEVAAAATIVPGWTPGNSVQGSSNSLTANNPIRVAGESMTESEGRRPHEY